MRKTFLLIFCAAFFLPPLNPQGSTQLVVPKEIFVGDTAEIRVIIHSKVAFLERNSEQGGRNIPIDSLPFPAEGERFSLKGARLLQNGAQHSVSLTIVPWETGALEIPSIDLAAAFGSSPPFIIDFQPVEVRSVLPQYGMAELRPPAAPLLVPGTLYAVYALAATLIALFALLFKLAGSRAAIASSVRRRLLLRKYARNAKSARKSLRILKKDAARIDDAAFCGRLVHILRGYSTVRFGRDFSAVTTRQIPDVFDEIFGGLLDGDAMERAESLRRIFIRADYVRFARNSIDSMREPKERYAAALCDGERGGLILSAEEFISGFDGGGKNA